MAVAVEIAVILPKASRKARLAGQASIGGEPGDAMAPDRYRRDRHADGFVPNAARGSRRPNRRPSSACRPIVLPGEPIVALGAHLFGDVALAVDGVKEDEDAGAFEAFGPARDGDDAAGFGGDGVLGEDAALAAGSRARTWTGETQPSARPRTRFFVSAPAIVPRGGIGRGSATFGTAGGRRERRKGGEMRQARPASAGVPVEHRDAQSRQRQ